MQEFEAAISDAAACIMMMMMSMPTHQLLSSQAGYWPAYWPTVHLFTSEESRDLIRC